MNRFRLHPGWALTLLVLAFVPFFPRLLAQAQSLSFTGLPFVTAANVTGTTAPVIWYTSVEASSQVEYGETTALGLEQANKVFGDNLGEMVDEMTLTHRVELQELKSGRTYYFRVVSVDAAGGRLVSDIGSFQTKAAACGPDDWKCGAWSACSKEGQQTRECTPDASCAQTEVSAPPETKRACTYVPPCVQDEWTCGPWGSCLSTSTQTRTCTLKFDCPEVETAKPPLVQACKLPLVVCTADAVTCGDWSKCDEKGVQVRTCKVPSDCPSTTPLPAQTQKCEPPKPPEEKEKVEGTVPETAPKPPEKQEQPKEEPSPQQETAATADTAGKTDRQEESKNLPQPPVSPEEKQMIEELKTASGLGSGGSGAGQQPTLDPACVERNLTPERCHDWLEARFSDQSCANAGKLTKESCLAWLELKAGGKFPGCEGKSESECRQLKDQATNGYMSEDEARKTEEIIRKAVDEDLVVSVPGLTAVDQDMAKDSAWYPSATTDQTETSSHLLVLDTDHDGLPDDLERRLGTDPTKPDFQAVTANGVVPRSVLKGFFERGDKPTQAQFSNIIDSLIHVNDDRYLLGLKQYNPSKEYLAGDTTVYDRPLLAVDLNGDGQADVRASFAVLVAVFGRADQAAKPEMSPFDRALLAGKPLEQPRGSGAVDKTFVISVGGGRTTPPDRAYCKSDKDCPPEYPACNNGICVGDGRDQNEPPIKRQAPPTNVLRGRAAPNSTVSIFVYSYIPVVLTTSTDENGNFTYDLAGGLADGNHTAYVTVADQDGRIVTKSDPLSFFVQGAQAMTMDEFMKTIPAVSAEPVRQMQLAYLGGTALAVLLAAGAAWLLVFRKRVRT